MKINRWTQYKDIKISAKLGIGFGVFVVLAFISAFISYLGSSAATQKIDLTSSVRMPVALTASRAQIDLLRMISDVRGYLVLGDREYWDSYLQSERTFRVDLDALEQLTPDFDPINAGRFDQLKQAYSQWSALPNQLYKLRNDQLDREPAYRLLATDGVRLAGQVLIKMNNLIDAPRVVSAQSVSYLQSMARFQGSFAAMLSALRGYTTTRNRIYRQEFDVNLAANSITWDEIWSKRDNLSEDQQKLLAQVSENRQAFLALPDQIFLILEGDRWREDLYLFRTSAVPITDKMNSLLTDMTTDQGTQLTTELDEGRQALITANFEILGGGIVAVLIALLLAFASRANIADPIRRLTSVAERIQGGDLAAQAEVESEDEIGILGRTFNSMTGWLRETLTQVRKEKKRADNLLTVVIPLGVQLSSEKNFDLLLERTLLGAKSFCHAGGGLLYLRIAGEMLKPVVVRFDSGEITPDKPVERLAVPLVDSAGDGQKRSIAVQVTLSGQSVNLDLNSGPQVLEYDFGLETHESGGIVPTSVLAIPLKNSAGEVLGVLELLDAKEAESNQAVPFDPNLQQLMESFSSLAAAALEAYAREQGLRREIQQLRIEIDEAKQHQQISEIVDTDFFQDLQTRARIMRKNRGRTSPQSE
jgi:CHASE3 domain sensor protein